MLDELIRKGKKTLEAPKASYYFHCEYTLLPDTPATLIDVVAYPIAAKVSRSRVIRGYNPK